MPHEFPAQAERHLDLADALGGLGIRDLEARAGQLDVLTAHVAQLRDPEAGERERGERSTPTPPAGSTGLSVELPRGLEKSGQLVDLEERALWLDRRQEPLLSLPHPDRVA